MVCVCMCVCVSRVCVARSRNFAILFRPRELVRLYKYFAAGPERSRCKARGARREHVFAYHATRGIGFRAHRAKLDDGSLVRAIGRSRKWIKLLGAYFSADYFGELEIPPARPRLIPASPPAFSRNQGQGGSTERSPKKWVSGPADGWWKNKARGRHRSMAKSPVVAGMKLKRISLRANDNGYMRLRRRGCLAKLLNSEKKIATRGQSKKGGREGRERTETFAYMVTDYRGTKGRRALGPLFLEETRRSFSLPRRHPSPRLLRVPCSELLITFACISPLFLPLARSSRCSSPSVVSFSRYPVLSLLLSLCVCVSCMHYAFEDRVIAADYAVAPGLLFRERNRELGLPRREP